MGARRCSLLDRSASSIAASENAQWNLIHNTEDCSWHYENGRRLGVCYKALPAIGKIGQAYAQLTGAWQSLLVMHLAL
jgi:mannose/fructose/N-acetylgalactosamine-specific phosphotransferase system component IID